MSPCKTVPFLFLAKMAVTHSSLSLEFCSPSSVAPTSTNPWDPPISSHRDACWLMCKHYNDRYKSQIKWQTCQPHNPTKYAEVTPVCEFFSPHFCNFIPQQQNSIAVPDEDDTTTLTVYCTKTFQPKQQITDHYHIHTDPHLKNVQMFSTVQANHVSILTVHTFLSLTVCA